MLNKVIGVVYTYDMGKWVETSNKRSHRVKPAGEASVERWQQANRSTAPGVGAAGRLDPPGIITL